MTTLVDTRNFENRAVRGPAFEEFSTRARSVASERETRMKQGESFFYTTYKETLADSSNRGLVFRLPTTATCVADVTLTWRASGLCLVELLEDSYFTYSDSSPFSDTVYNKRRLSANTPSVQIGFSESGGMTAGTAIFQEITGAAGLSAGKFRFMPKRNTDVGNQWYLYWLRITNNSGGGVSMDANAQWTEYEEVR